MNCEKCNGKTKVTNSRRLPNGFYRRYRKCLKCGHIGVTVEMTTDHYETLSVEKLNKIRAAIRTLMTVVDVLEETGDGL